MRVKMDEDWRSAPKNAKARSTFCPNLFAKHKTYSGKKQIEKGWAAISCVFKSRGLDARYRTLKELNQTKNKAPPLILDTHPRAMRREYHTSLENVTIVR